MVARVVEEMKRLPPEEMVDAGVGHRCRWLTPGGEGRAKLEIKVAHFFFDDENGFDRFFFKWWTVEKFYFR
ncbi:hypothetical protein QJS10_CPB20g00806 [Acorus calamus]|uniref:Uncharacterized protein n=1 Tax=Acorus calamus TaxID=4465 RepID=A0AAV9CCN5_ACOCL|nr:hypothetical protein QJS10_CPB20g00806 [Acorus calamus]